jgi:non-heme chloroperoxidase
MNRKTTFMKNIFPINLLSLLLFTNTLIGQNASLEIPQGSEEKYFLTSDSAHLRYIVSGKGEALIFIPGWTMPAEIWEKQIEHFSKTHLVVALDPRSQGKSSQTAEGLYLERQAKDLKELVDHMHLSSFYLIGWSWAGPMLYSYLKLFNSSSIKGVVIVDAPVKIDQAFLKRMAIRIKALVEDRPGTTEKFVRGLYKQPQTESYLKKVIEASSITPTNSAVTLIAVFFFYNDSEWIQTLKTCDKPLLFIGMEGKEDMLNEINKEVKLDYVIIPGAGHTLFVDKPVEFNAIINNFISKK